MVGSANIFDKSCEILGVKKEVCTIKKYTDMIKFEHKFDLINASLICFNNKSEDPQRADFWGINEWLYFLNDLYKNQMNSKGIIHLGMNFNGKDLNKPEKFFGDEQLHNLFDPFLVSKQQRHIMLTQSDLETLLVKHKIS